MKTLKEFINDIFNSHNMKELENIRKNPEIIKEIANPTEAQQLAAVESSSYTIKYIKEPTKKVRLTALKDDIYNYSYIKELTGKEQLYLIKQGVEIKDIKNPIEKVQLYALRWKNAFIADIKNPTEKVQLITVKKDKELFLDIKNPTITTCREIARAYCGDIEIPADKKIIKPTKKLVSNLREMDRYAYLKGMAINQSKGYEYADSELTKIANWSKQKEKQIIADYKYEIGITTEKGKEPTINIEKESASQNETPSKKNHSFSNTSNLSIEEKTEDITTSPKEVDTDNKELSLENTNNADFNFQQSSPPSNIKISVENQLLGSKLSEEYRKLGYESVAESIDCSVKTLAANSGVTVCTDEQYQIIKSGSKTLYGDITVENKNGILNVSINNLLINDKSTGKIEPLNVGDIDLSKQSSKSIKELLSGKQVEMTNKSRIAQMVGLSKTPVGWGLQIGKQIFSATDAGAEV